MQPHPSLRKKLTRAFLWLSVLSWGTGFGGKLFDLLVVVRAWGANPPVSLSLYPYGKRFPMNPGDFFQPVSILMAIAILGALVSGWKTPRSYRLWLWIPVVLFALIWAATPSIFWPIINELYVAAKGTGAVSSDRVTELIHNWFVYDWLRTAVIAAGFLSSIQSISQPYPEALS